MNLMRTSRLAQWVGKQMSATAFLLIFSPFFFTALTAQVSVSISKTDPACNGFTNGSATATAAGGTAPYTYRWSTGATSAGIAGVGAGTYTVTATDAALRTGTASITLVNPSPLSMTVSFADICNNGAVTASATGGTSPYTFAWGSGRTGATQSGLTGGTGYNITVTDSKGCAATKFVIVPGAFSTNLRIGELVCFGDCDAAVDALPQGGTGPFTYKWNTGATTQSIVGIPSGTYSVTVTDANNCTSSASGTVINPPQIIVSAAITAASCGGAGTGSATASATGGRPPFTFKWSNGQTTATATGLSVGDYFVTATDSKGCARAAKVIIPTNATFTLSIAKVDASCGASNGSATVTVTSGRSPFTYKWSTNATTPTITGLGAGTYTVTVTDANGCAAVTGTTVNASGNLSISVSKTDAACGITNGTASVTILSGTSPYTYKWSTNATTSSINLLAAGTYTVTVTDSNGCTAIGSTVINQTSSFDVLVDVRNITCNGGTDGSASAMVMGGSSPYTYRWSNGSTVALIANLTSGSYTVVVTDANGCTATKTVSVSQPSAINSTTNVTSTSCAATNGSASVVVNGGTPAYTYQWSNGATTATISNLASGTYTVTITDSKGCKATNSAVVASSSGLDATISVSNPKCFGQTGSATVSPTGAVGTVTYAWSTGATTPSVSNLAAGNYSVTINDSRACSVVKQFSITQPSLLSVSVSATSSSCGLVNGAASATTTGGTAPYTYLWSNNATTSSLTNVAAGTYNLTVTDANGCTATGSATIGNSANLTLSVVSTNVKCNGGNDGSATVTVIGGVAPLTYSWTNGATTATASGLIAGNYAVTVRDAAGCIQTQIVSITQPTAIAILTNVTNAACGSANGSITLTVGGGTPQYSYRWSNGATTANISGLGAGTFTVTVTDANNCTKTTSVTVTSVNSPDVTITVRQTIVCNGGTTGDILASATGGTPGYTYKWNTGFITPFLSGIAAGTYTVTVTDAAGCFGVKSVTLTQPTAIVLTTSAVNATCLAIGSATVSATGGTPAYTYAWSNGGTTSTISNLAGGTYSVTVTDANGCKQVAIVSVPSVTSTDLTCSVVITHQVSVVNGNDGEATVAGAGGLAPYTYKWSSGQTINIAQGLSPGTVTVTVTDARGCKSVCSTSFFNPTCVNVTNPGTIRGNQTFCPGAGALTGIFELTPASGGSTADLEYMWMYSDLTIDFNASTWFSIPAAMGKDLPANLLPSITRKTYFIRCVRRKGCNEFKESNIVIKEPLAVADWDGPLSACLNQTVTFTGFDNGTGAIYVWTFAGANITTSTSRVVTVKFTSLGQQQVKLQVIKAGCQQTKLYTLTVSNCLGNFGTILAFTANAMGTSEVMLNWATTNERIQSRYIIEKSADGINFSKFGEVASQNRDNNLYRFADESPKMGRSFYRVRQMSEIDEEIAVSTREKVLIAAKDQPVVTYPNPVGNTLFVEVVDVENTEGVVEVYDELGRFIKSQRFNANDIRVELDLALLAKGNYLLKVTRTDGNSKTLKISKF